MIPQDLADLIKLNHENAYDQAVVYQLRQMVNGDPWDVITQIVLINNKVNQDRMFELIVPSIGIEDSEIIPLSNELPAVEPFEYDLLPDDLAPWVKDIADRIQCPVDFIAVTALVGLASVLGRKAAIHPKQHDDWLVVPNLWGALIGRPSTMKSPAMAEGLRPLKRLAAASRKEYGDAMTLHKTDRVTSELTDNALKDALKKAIKSQKVVSIEQARNAYTKAQQEEVAAPTERRYIVNDTTIEKLGELLNQNQNGLLLERDELTGWLKSLDREDRAADRAFYLECFSGTNAYTYDRIGRGTVHIESTTVSIVGGIQPSKLRPYIWGALNQGPSDDGLIQRFQLSVYPDDIGQWQHVDRWPDNEAKSRAWEVFQRIDGLPPLATDEEGRLIGSRFDAEGQVVFNQWLADLERKIRTPDIHPAIESHLVKYRSLMPSLALLINVVEVGQNRPVIQRSALKAAGWCEYLESHAYRIYGGGINPAVQNAITIFDRRKQLPVPFTARHIHRKGWAGLSEIDQVKKALTELIEHGYLAEVKESPPESGRPSFTYFWNPNLGRRKQ